MQEFVPPHSPGTPPDQYVRPQLAKAGSKQIITGVIKLAFVGRSGVGKTRAWRLMASKADCTSSPAPTRGVEWVDLLGMSESGDCVMVLLHDLSGHEKYRAVAPPYYRTMNGYFAMFDMPAEARRLRQDMGEPKLSGVPACKLADIHAKQLIDLMLRNAMTAERSAHAFPFKGLESPLVVCMGNKSDLCEDIECESLLRHALIACLDAQSSKYFDTSAVTGQGIGQAFSWMAETAIRRIAEHIKSQGYPPYMKPGCVDSSTPSAAVDAQTRSAALGSMFPETVEERQRRMSRMSPMPESVNIAAAEGNEVFTCAC